MALWAFVMLLSVLNGFEIFTIYYTYLVETSTAAYVWNDELYHIFAAIQEEYDVDFLNQSVIFSFLIIIPNVFYHMFGCICFEKVYFNNKNAESDMAFFLLFYFSTILWFVCLSFKPPVVATSLASILIILNIMVFIQFFQQKKFSLENCLILFFSSIFFTFLIFSSLFNMCPPLVVSEF